MPCVSVSVSQLCRTLRILHRERRKWVVSHTAGEARRSLTHALSSVGEIEGDQGFLGPRCAALVRSEWPSKVKLFRFAFFTAPKLRFYFAPMVCRNFSTGLSDSHKSTLFHGWLSKSGFFKGEDGRKVLFCHFDGISLLKWQFNAIYRFPLAVTCLIQFTWKLRRRVARFCSILFYHQSNKAVLGHIW